MQSLKKIHAWAQMKVPIFKKLVKFRKILINFVIKTFFFLTFKQPCIRRLFFVKNNGFIGVMVLTLVMTSLLPRL